MYRYDKTKDNKHVRLSLLTNEGKIEPEVGLRLSEHSHKRITKEENANINRDFYESSYEQERMRHGKSTFLICSGMHCLHTQSFSLTMTSLNYHQPSLPRHGSLQD